MLIVTANFYLKNDFDCNSCLTFKLDSTIDQSIQESNNEYDHVCHAQI